MRAAGGPCAAARRRVPSRPSSRCALTTPAEKKRPPPPTSELHKHNPARPRLRRPAAAQGSRPALYCCRPLRRRRPPPAGPTPGGRRECQRLRAPRPELPQTRTPELRRIARSRLAVRGSRSGKEKNVLTELRVSRRGLSRRLLDKDGGAGAQAGTAHRRVRTPDRRLAPPPAGRRPSAPPSLICSPLIAPPQQPPLPPTIGHRSLRRLCSAKRPLKRRSRGRRPPGARRRRLLRRRPPRHAGRPRGGRQGPAALTAVGALRAGGGRIRRRGARACGVQPQARDCALRPPPIALPSTAIAALLLLSRAVV